MRPSPEIHIVDSEARLRKVHALARQRARRCVTLFTQRRVSATNRMARRVAICAATPTAFGMASFLVSYWLVSRQIIDVPPALTLLVSGGFFLLGLLGLSYGLFSSSWLEAPGSFLGFEQIGVNIQRLRNGAVARRSEQP